MGGAAKNLALHYQNNDQGLRTFPYSCTAWPCCNEKWRIQYGRKAKTSNFLDFSTKIFS